MTRVSRIVAAAAAFLVLLTPTVARAQSGADEPLLDLARLVYQRVMAGDYVPAAAGVLVLVVGLARRYGSQLVPWLATDAGGTVLVAAGSLGGAMLTALLAGVAPSWSTVGWALAIAWGASGGYAALKRLVFTPLRPRADAWPSWARALYRTVAWIFDRPQTATTRATTSPILIVLLVALASCSTSCATVKAAGSAGANTALVCQSQNLEGLALETYRWAYDVVYSLVAPSGEVDTVELRKQARKVRDDARRCGFAAALAAVTEAMSQRRGALGIGPSPAYVLRRELEAIARDDWQRQLRLDGEAFGPSDDPDKGGQ